jgi:hypothetical protein
MTGCVSWARIKKFSAKDAMGAKKKGEKIFAILAFFALKKNIG